MARGPQVLGVSLALLCLTCTRPDLSTDASFRLDTPPERTLVPIETSDDELLEVLGSLDTLPIFGTPRLALQSSADRGLGGPYPTTLLERDNRDMNHFVCLGEGSDVREGLVPHRYDLPSCPEPWVRGAVVSRVEGAGAMVRLWATLFSMRGRPPDRERLRVFVDGEREPLIDVPLSSALDGSASPIFAPPFGAGRSDRLAWTYPVVFSSRLVVALDHIRASDLVYHQTTVRLDPTGAVRVPAAGVSPARETARVALDATAVGTTPSVRSVTLGARESRSAMSLLGPATVRVLRVRAVTRAALEPVLVRVTWDAAAAPAIDLPVLDLFAASRGAPPSAGLVRSRDVLGELELSLHLPMPFAVSADVALENLSDAPVTLTLEIETDAGVPSESFGRLTTERRETVGPTSLAAHPLATVAGRGRLVGVCLMLEGRAMDTAGPLFADPLNFLEGDETMLVDGVASLLGTGTEDYLDGAFYFERGPSVTPFAQVWDVATDGATGVGHASACRWHVRTAAIDFAASLEAMLEIGPGEPATLVRYRSVAYVYR